MTPQEMNEKRQNATVLAQLWNSYFPALTVPTSYWRLELEQWSFVHIEKAIKKCAQKNLQLESTMTLKQMLAYISAVSYRAKKQGVGASR